MIQVGRLLEGGTLEGDGLVGFVVTDSVVSCYGQSDALLERDGQADEVVPGIRSEGPAVRSGDRNGRGGSAVFVFVVPGEIGIGLRHPTRVKCDEDRAGDEFIGVAGQFDAAISGFGELETESGADVLEGKVVGSRLGFGDAREKIVGEGVRHAFLERRQVGEYLVSVNQESLLIIGVNGIDRLGIVDADMALKIGYIDFSAGFGCEFLVLRTVDDVDVLDLFPKDGDEIFIEGRFGPFLLFGTGAEGHKGRFFFHGFGLRGLQFFDFGTGGGQEDAQPDGAPG